MTTTPHLQAPLGVRQLIPPHRRVLIGARVWLARHAVDMTLVVPLLVVAGVVHAVGMDHYPRWVDDPGTYLSQAWAVQYEQRLSPYSYFYDHAPGGWVQMALWSMLTNGFDRHYTAIGFGNECMLIAKLVSVALLYPLARRIGMRRVAATAATLAFALSPLALTYTRWTYLDNLATPWLLGAFVLAYSRRRSLLAGTGAAACFGMAALTKETALVLLPAFGWAMVHNLDRRNRPQVILLATCAGLLVMAMYPLLALYKGELFPGAGHNSLLGTAAWQLDGRASSGSVLDPDSSTAQLLTDWLSYDRILLLGSLAAIPIGLLARRLRPVTAALVIQWLLLVRGGYVPFMQVIAILPWAALLLAGAVDAIAGNAALTNGRRWRPARGFRRVPRLLVAATLALALTGAAVLEWTPQVRHMMTTQRAEPLRQATIWVADNVPRDKVLVVHDSIWVDLVQRYGFERPPVIAYKLDSDPAVRESLERIDYIVVPTWYYTVEDSAQKYPTLTEASKHAVTVASFGSGPDSVRVLRVSAYWRP